MKILVITDNQNYINPTSNNFVSELVSRDGVVLSGVGHAVNSKNIRNIEKKFGKFDLIYSDMWALLAQKNRDENLVIVNSPYVDNQPEDIFDINTPIILSALAFDIHGLGRELFHYAIDKADAVISSAVSPQFSILNELSDIKEPWFNKEDYVLKNSSVINHRFNLFPHCISEQEFKSVNFNTTKRDISVLGVKYNFRKNIIDSVKKNSTYTLETLTDLPQRLLAKLISGKHMKKFNFPIKLYKKRFSDAVSSSRISITCDGSIGYPIRKYFEIPAFGTLLCAKFFKDAKHLGFLDRENCFYLENYDIKQIDEIFDFINSDSAAYENMVISGQEMIGQKHTAKKRVDQFLAFAEQVAGGKKVTTRWENGEQRIHEYSNS